MADIRSTLDALDGYRSREAGLFVAQLDALNRQLTEDTREFTPADLAWQSAPGINTIGMLLAHIAIAEVAWIQVGPQGRESIDCRKVLGIDADDDGLPLPPDGAPPDALYGKDLAFYDDLLARAREFTRRATRSLGDDDLSREMTRRRQDGSTRIFNIRWVLHHLIEHEAGHCGQILLLRHLQRAQPKR